MLIRVIYKDDKYDFVKPFRLDEFLDAGKISMFRRRSGWVFVGIDRIRVKENYPSYPARERRQPREKR
jgi:hypothetical protein